MIGDNAMGGFFDFVAAHCIGIFTIAFSAFALVLGLQWVCWILGWGRFKSSSPPKKIRDALTNLFVKITDEFRHLLAFLLVVVFAIALIMMLVPGIKKGDITLMEAGLKAVVASLGSLMAVIIGYYFGESAGKTGATPPKEGAVTKNQTPEKSASGESGGSSKDPGSATSSSQTQN